MVAKRKWILVLLIVILAGCSSTRIVSEVQLIHSLGLDLEDQKIKGAAITHIYGKEKTQIELLETKSSNLFTILPDFNAITPSQVELGQLRSVIVGRNYAENGVETLVHTLCRDPAIGFRLQLAVAEPKALTILKGMRHMQVPFFISDSVAQNIKTLNMPKTNLHIFLFHLYGEGRDPYLPYFVMHNDRVKLDGVALFRDDKFVHRINSKESFLLKIMVEKAKSGQIPFEVTINNRKESGLLKNLHSHAVFDLNTTKPIPSIMVKLTVNGQIKDYSKWLQLSNPQVLHQMEKELSSYLQKEATSFVKHLQKLGVDPVGFGDFVRSRSASWNYSHFKKIYPQIKIAVTASIKLEQTGE
ncbi:MULTISPECIES: Ger(x)C family spore germination protein [Brevibacillus]|uniref:Ger(x)C family spore germination protein n=1 Tax=Brevibacillus TaxID=55080 RepID=UPI0036430220